MVGSPCNSKSFEEKVQIGGRRTCIWSEVFDLGSLHSTFGRSDRVLASNQTRLSLQIPFEILAPPFRSDLGVRSKSISCGGRGVSCKRTWSRSEMELHCLEYISLHLSYVLTCECIDSETLLGVVCILWQIYCIHIVTSFTLSSYMRVCWAYLWAYLIVLCTYFIYVCGNTCNCVLVEP